MLNNQLNLSGSIARTHFGINELLGLDSSATQNLLSQQPQQQQRAAQQITSTNSIYNQQQQTSATAEHLFESFGASASFVNSGAYRMPPHPSTYLSSGLYSSKGATFPIFTPNAAGQSCKLCFSIIQSASKVFKYQKHNAI